jgi:predicted secreted protein
MTWLGTAVIFVVVWWLVLFMVLPFGAAPPAEVEPGMATSAPAKPRLAVKMAITTILAALLTALITWLIDSGLIHLRPQAGVTPDWWSPIG